MLLSGKEARKSLTQELITRIRQCGHTPCLAIVQAGNRPDSSAFIKAKISFGDRVGIRTRHIRVEESVSEGELVSVIQDLNKDGGIDGIIVQLPLPAHLDKRRIIDTIDVAKDADALTTTRVREWSSGIQGALIPATARGVRELLDYYGVSLEHKKVVVLGRSELVGVPIAAMCNMRGANVVVCHSKTHDIPSISREADIIIVAIGRPHHIGSEYVRKGQIIIDIGINKVDGSKLEEEIVHTRIVGDVDFDSVEHIVGAITPVPGGVGPMTVLALFENVVELVRKY